MALGVEVGWAVASVGKEPVTNQQDLMTAIEIARTYLLGGSSGTNGLGNGDSGSSSGGGSGGGSGGMLGNHAKSNDADTLVPITFLAPSEVEAAAVHAEAARMEHLEGVAGRSMAITELDGISDADRRLAATRTKFIGALGQLQVRTRELTYYRSAV